MNLSHTLPDLILFITGFSAFLASKVRLFVYKGFISDQDCDHLISLARSSNGGMPTKLELPLDLADAVISRIEEKISAWALLPKVNGRPLQILHYSNEKPEQRYEYHGNNSDLETNHPLMASVILYLSNVTQGGELFFPNSELGKKSSIRCNGKMGFLRPVKGNAVLFFHVHPNATVDKSSSHVRHPVLEGVMRCATKVFYTSAAREEEVGSVSDEGCADEDDSCPLWAALGECQRNPVFMVGSPDYYGTCMKSCKVC